jgi:hypothetical protein
MRGRSSNHCRCTAAAAAAEEGDTSTILLHHRLQQQHHSHSLVAHPSSRPHRYRRQVERDERAPVPSLQPHFSLPLARLRALLLYPPSCRRSLLFSLHFLLCFALSFACAPFSPLRISLSLSRSCSSIVAFPIFFHSFRAPPPCIRLSSCSA